MEYILQADLYTNQLDWVDWFESIHFFSTELIEMVQFIFQGSSLMIESIRFHKVSEWVDWIWVTDMMESIQLIKKMFQKVNEFEIFPKRLTIYWVDRWIRLNYLSYSCELIGPVHT